MWNNEDREDGITLFRKILGALSMLSMLAIIGLVLVVLTACASKPYWYRVADPLPVERIIEVDTILATWGHHVNGYAIRGEKGCTIIISTRVLDHERVLAHEKKHCDGWNHD